MKYSIFIPYVKRAGHLHNTLISFCHHYSDRKDFEVIICEDLKNINDTEEHEALMKVLKTFEDKLNINFIQDLTPDTWNPAKMFNECAKVSKGIYFILTNPEGYHVTNILSGLDVEYDCSPDRYIVCSSRNMKGCNLFITNFYNLGGTFHMWYQHSKHRNRMLHFCTSLSKENYYKIGAFNERYIYGSGKEDVEFLKRVQKSHMEIVIRDDLETVHIAHERVALKDSNPQKLRMKNSHLIKGTQ